MDPLYISATLQDSGKTSFMCGLMQSLRTGHGMDVGYIKPVGQRYVLYQGEKVDKDAAFMRDVFGLDDPPGRMSPVIIERGFTERYIFNRDAATLEARIIACADALAKKHQALLVEGTGHAGVGSCIDLSNARVAHLLGARVIIIAAGGIGRPIDEVALSLSLFRDHGVEVLGVVLNKVLPEKYDRIKKAVAKGLEHLGTRLLGAIPVIPALICASDAPEGNNRAAQAGPGVPPADRERIKTAADV
ncbi:MAG: AAA family ATPase, partial [Phycisphaerae bacterium]|nr:AAA family ATPase [Phycisphaerae bacterium]